MEAEVGPATRAEVAGKEIRRLRIAPTADLSIEFGHIYTDEAPRWVHFRQAAIAGKLRQDERLVGKTVSLCLLVDDYNAERNELDLPTYLGQLDEAGLRPDHVVSEAGIASVAENSLAMHFSPVAQMSVERYWDRHGKYPCSFLVSVWYLARLGYLGLPESCFVEHGSQPFAASSLVGMLDRSYLGVERTASRLLRHSRHGDLSTLLSYRFVDDIE